MDWSAALQANNEPGLIKKALPIAFVLEYVGLDIYNNDGRLNAICPFHLDRDPSFDIYPWRGGERWGCFVCGIGGDVLDLIQRIWPELGFQQAKQVGGNLIISMKGADWTAPKLAEKIPFDHDRAQDLLRQGRSNGDGPAKLTAWCQARTARFTGDFLRLKYEVVILGNEILIPFRNFDGKLVGIKHRSLTGGRPIAMAGSELAGVFYGEHMWENSNPEVSTLLTEGESDTWTGAAVSGKMRNVLGLPTGAGTRPFGFEHLSHNVELAFDGDVAGRNGERKWADALKAEGHKVWGWNVPDGYDLTSWFASDGVN